MGESKEARENRLDRYKRYYQKHKEKHLARNKEWREENPERVKEVQREWQRKYGREHMKKRREGLIGLHGPDDGDDWQERNREHHLAQKRENTNRRRQEVFMEALEHYGGSPPKCYCCGESIPILLCLDHVEGEGNKHRKENKISHLSQWAKRNDWPDLFRVACHSCNMGAHLNGGVCPHQQAA